MAINFQSPTFPATAASVGVPDWGKALQQGFENYKSGVAAQNSPKKMAEELLSSQLSNKIKGIQAQYAEPLAKLGLQEKQANLSLSPLRQKLIEAQIAKASRPEQVKGKLADLYRLRQNYDEGTPERGQIDQAIGNYVRGSQGITVLDPKTGLPMVQIGGSGSGRGQGGQIYQTASGEVVQKPTSTVLTQLQNRVAGHELVKPYIENAIKTLPQFQSGWAKLGSKLAGSTNRWIGTDIDLPSQLKEGESSLGLAAEGMVKQFGLNATGHNLKRMEEILTPGEDESQDGYRRRAERQVIEFATQALKAQEYAGRGIPLSSPPSMSIDLPALGEGTSKSEYSQDNIAQAKAELARRRNAKK